MSEAALAELAGPLRPLGLGEMARVLGGFCYVEERAFASLGALSTTPGAGVRLRLWAAAAARTHARRAGELGALLPVSANLPGRSELVVSPGAVTEAWLGSLGEALARPSAQLREAVDKWYGVLAAAYEARLASGHPTADGPFRLAVSRFCTSFGGIFEDLGG